MKRSFVHTAVVYGAVLLLTSVAGCAGKGELRHLNLQTKPSAAPSAGTEPVKIVIEPFEDLRMNKTHVGVRSHLGGGVTLYDLKGGRPVDVIVQSLISRLQSRGWGNRAWNVSLGQAGSDAEADIIITGQVEEFSANAKSRWFSTRIETKNRFTIEAKNVVDESTTTRRVEGTRSKTVFWFNEEDVRELLVDTLNDGIDRFIADTTISEKSLRPVR